MLPLKTFDLPGMDTFLNRFESEGTKRAYRRDLKAFQAWATNRGVECIQAFSVQHGMEYRSHLASKHSKGTVNRRLSCLKSYVGTLVQLGILERNAVECLDLYPNQSFEPTPGMSDEEAVKLLTREVYAKELNALRDAAIIGCLLYLGLRRDEVASLTINSIGKDGGISTLEINGKGNKTRTLPIPLALKKLLTEFLYTREVYAIEEPLFFSIGGNGERRKLSGQSIYNVFKKYSKKLGLSGDYSPHSCRVTCVSNALENSSPLQVQYMGGWSSMEMVLRYDRRRQNLKNSAVFAVNYRK